MRHRIVSISNRLSAWMETIAGIALTGIMFLIGADIIGRYFGCPVPGTYEIVSIAGGLIIGLALPATSRAGAHVSTDLLLSRLSEKSRTVLVVITRLIGTCIFVLAGCGMIAMGLRLKAAGEVTAVLALPFYYAIYAIGGAFLIQALVLLSEILRQAENQNLTGYCEHE